MQERCFALAARFGAGTILCIGLVSLATPFLSGAYYERWFSWPQILFTAQVPLLVAIASVGFFVSLRRRRDYWPFLLALALFALCLAGLGVSIYPDVVPGAVTIHEAAAPHSSLVFMLVGAVLFFRSSWPIPAIPIGCFAGKPATRAIIERPCPARVQSSICWPTRS